MATPGYFVSAPTALTYYPTRRAAVLAASLVPEASVIREAEDAPGMPAGKSDEGATAEAQRMRDHVRVKCPLCSWWQSALGSQFMKDLLAGNLERHIAVEHYVSPDRLRSQHPER